MKRIQSKEEKKNMAYYIAQEEGEEEEDDDDDYCIGKREEALFVSISGIVNTKEGYVYKC